MFSLSGLRKIDEGGVVFNSHLNGDRLPLPRIHRGRHAGLSATYKWCLTSAPSIPSATNLRARACSARCAGRARRTVISCAHGKPDPPRPVPDRAGLHVSDLRRECALPNWRTWTDGCAIGGLSWNRGRSASKWWKPPGRSCRAPKPRYAIDCRMPVELPEYVARGIRRMMDCVLPSQRAQRIPVYLQARDHQTRPLQDDERPLDPNCPCYTCARRIPGPIFAISSRLQRFCIPPWRHVTTYSGTLTSCVGLGTL